MDNLIDAVDWLFILGHQGSITGILKHTIKSLLTGSRSRPGAEHTHGVTCRYNAALLMQRYLISKLTLQVII